MFDISHTIRPTEPSSEKWLKPPKVKVLRKSDAMRRELDRLNPGLNPKNCLRKKVKDLVGENNQWHGMD